MTRLISISVSISTRTAGRSKSIQLVAHAV
jgi:hypothetical protein